MMIPKMNGLHTNELLNYIIVPSVSGKLSLPLSNVYASYSSFMFNHVTMTTLMDRGGVNR